jgi:hypothetical protein
VNSSTFTVVCGTGPHTQKANVIHPVCKKNVEY